MQKYKKPVFTEEQLGQNPCAIPLVIDVNEVMLDDQFRVETDNTRVNVFYYAEREEVCKLYTGVEQRKIVSACTPAAKSLLLWLFYEVDYGKDYLWINKDRYMEENFVSLNTYKKAVQELHRYALIAPSTVKDVWWINPRFFFKGSRIDKYPDKINVEYSCSIKSKAQ